MGENLAITSKDYLSLSDGIIHFYLPYIPGVLRAEGYIGAMKVSEDVLYSDHEAENLTVTVDRAILPADGRSVAMIDLVIDDKHGRRYMLEDRQVTVTAEGAPVEIRMDNGSSWDTEPFLRTECPTCNGHLLILVKAGTVPGEVKLTLDITGFDQREISLRLE